MSHEVNHVVINEPFWKDRSVSVHNKYCNGDIMLDIVYTDKQGKRIWPKTFLLPYTTVQAAKARTVKGIVMKVFYIDDLVSANLYA